MDGKLISEGEFVTLNYCTAETEITFLTFLESPKYLDQLINNEQISCVLCTEEVFDLLPPKPYGIFVTKEPKVAFYKIHNSLVNNTEYILPKHKTIIGEKCKISPLAYIASDNVTIGNNVIIGEFVSINEHTRIGNNCIIHQGTVIGGKGFSFTRQGTDNVLGLLDMGQTIIEDDVEICSNCHIASSLCE